MINDFIRTLLEMSAAEANDLIRTLREMSAAEANAKIHRQEERYKKRYIAQQYKQAQIKHIQKQYNNTKHK